MAFLRDIIWGTPAVDKAEFQKRKLEMKQLSDALFNDRPVTVLTKHQQRVKARLEARRAEYPSFAPAPQVEVLETIEQEKISDAEIRMKAAREKHRSVTSFINDQLAKAQAAREIEAEVPLEVLARLERREDQLQRKYDAISDDFEQDLSEIEAMKKSVIEEINNKETPPERVIRISHNLSDLHVDAMNLARPDYKEQVAEFQQMLKGIPARVDTSSPEPLEPSSSRKDPVWLSSWILGFSQFKLHTFVDKKVKDAKVALEVKQDKKEVKDREFVALPSFGRS